MKMDIVVKMTSNDRDSDDINNTNSSNKSCSDINNNKRKIQTTFLYPVFTDFAFYLHCILQ